MNTEKKGALPKKHEYLRMPKWLNGVISLILILTLTGCLAIQDQAYERRESYIASTQTASSPLEDEMLINASKFLRIFYPYDQSNTDDNTSFGMCIMTILHSTQMDLDGDPQTPPDTVLQAITASHCLYENEDAMIVQQVGEETLTGAVIQNTHLLPTKTHDNDAAMLMTLLADSAFANFFTTPDNFPQLGIGGVGNGTICSARGDLYGKAYGTSCTTITRTGEFKGYSTFTNYLLMPGQSGSAITSQENPMIIIEIASAIPKATLFDPGNDELRAISLPAGAQETADFVWAQDLAYLQSLTTPP